MDPYTGYDWTVAATDSGKKFNGFAVKDIKLTPRRKPSALFGSGKGSDKAKIEATLESIPDLGAHFRKLVPGTEKINTILERFLNPDVKDENNAEVSAGGTEHGSKGDTKVNAAKDKINSAFDDLDNSIF